ncbi:MAG: chemotaxis protein CheX [Fibrobacterota bacterium]
METDKLSQIVSEACGEVLEKMMFLEAWQKEPYTARDFVLEKELVGGIAFQGEFNGRIIVNCSRRLAEAATLGLLGVEPDALLEEQVKDTVKEMANMICGSVFSKIDSVNSLVKLGIPSCVDLKIETFPFKAEKEIMVFPFSCGSITPDSEEEEVFLLEISIDSQPDSSRQNQ